MAVTMQANFYHVFNPFLFFNRRFLEAGKHVLVEYPMALSAQAARELWQLAEQKGDEMQYCKIHDVSDKSLILISNVLDAG